MIVCFSGLSLFLGKYPPMQQNFPPCETGLGSRQTRPAVKCTTFIGKRETRRIMDPEIEEELYRFGPMGVSISFARPGIFVWSRQNNTEVVLTSRRIYGQGKMPAFASMFGKAGTPVFDVPLQEIIAIEPVDFLMNKAVWIRYRTRPGKKRSRSSGQSSVTVI